MNNKLNQFVSLLMAALGLFLSISFAVFLFVLFFEPFPLDKFEFNNRLIYVAGMAAIAFLVMVLIRITLPWLIKKYDQHTFDPLLPPYANSFIIFFLTAASYGLYIYYVGGINLTMAILFKITLISLAVPVSLQLHDLIKELKKQNAALLKEKEVIEEKVEKFEEDYLSKSIDFISDSSNEKLSVLISDVAFVKSADNYVQIVFQEGDELKSKLIRNTLKNIELQLQPYANFIRCHRICIVNIHFIEHLNKDESSHSLSIKNYADRLPVSRQYLLKLKDAI
jgi:DNA-binding LytR/AlgR family response regulator